MELDAGRILHGYDDQPLFVIQSKSVPIFGADRLGLVTRPGAASRRAVAAESVLVSWLNINTTESRSAAACSH